ncbi:UDP-N-acetylbacillosamine N-acetyltransferase [Marinobacterium sp. MBR-111]|jgi:sugar O-acyltransferase (sialic acid O-acetyltransferase NeuD family)|uniref:NeuD/PglB/VioB family sugar acetyltransferase n=1 Tax=Marinobacterium sp. MBR-111 TaxID=3156463 RepID=UPI0033940708
MESENLIIYGTGPLAKLLYYYLSDDSEYNVKGFCVNADYISESEFLGLPVVPFEEIEKTYPPTEYGMLLAIGYSKMRVRKKLFNDVKNKGYILVNYVHSSVIKHNVVMGENNIIFAGCIIEPNVKIGNNNIIWSMTLLGHDCIIGNHNYISAKCLISGDSQIFDLCFIGNGATMINGLLVNNETCVGAASYLRKSTDEKGLYVGNPSKLIKYNKNGIEL